ncbi:MAG TPA: hypothetical protein VIX37_17480 [Candidatus Sulfotelmatobacter sp.]
MKPKDQSPVDADWQSDNDELDRQLDAALAKYSDVEPRAGLEDRVLANLRTDRAQVPDRRWWRWSLAGAIAAIVVVSVALAWRSGKSSNSVVANHPPAATQAPKQPATQVVSKTEEKGVRPSRWTPTSRVTAPRSHLAVKPSARPKLDQFPSPQPPSQQELALRRYASQFPEEAKLIGLEQEKYEKEIQQQMKEASSENTFSDSDQQER